MSLLKKVSRFLLGIAVVGCASGEIHEGVAPGSSSGVPNGPECQVDEDCNDNDPGTDDFCDDNGYCVHITNTDIDTGTETEAIDSNCEIDGVVYADSKMGFYFRNLVSQGGNDQSLSDASIIKLVVDEPRRVWIAPTDKMKHDIWLILLSDCVNSERTRIDWGKTIYSDLLEPGTYYIAAFSENENYLNFGFNYLRSIDCTKADKLTNDLETMELDGLADDFSGSCVITADDDGPRPDTVLTFEVPQQEMWNVRIDLVPLGEELEHYMYLRLGCDYDGTVELGCTAEFEPPSDLHQPEPDRMVLRAKNLEPGLFSLIVDTKDPSNFDSGQFDLFFNYQLVTNEQK